MTDALAERYCEIADLLREVDPDAIAAKIERLTRLHAMAVAIRGLPGPPLPAVAELPADEPPEPTQSRERGYWRKAIAQVLGGTARPLGLKELCMRLRTLDLMTSSERDSSVYNALANTRDIFRRTAQNQQLWELVPGQEINS